MTAEKPYLNWRDMVGRLGMGLIAFASGTQMAHALDHKLHTLAHSHETSNSTLVFITFMIALTLIAALMIKKSIGWRTDDFERHIEVGAAATAAYVVVYIYASLHLIALFTSGSEMLWVSFSPLAMPGAIFLTQTIIAQFRRRQYALGKKPPF